MEEMCPKPRHPTPFETFFSASEKRPVNERTASSSIRRRNTSEYSGAASDLIDERECGTVNVTAAVAPPARVRVALLTGGVDKPYAVGLAEALAASGVSVDVIGGDAIDCPQLHTTPEVRFLNLRGSQGASRAAAKVVRLAKYYLRLAKYAATTDAPTLHVLWHTKALEYVDRTLLLLYFKIMRKRIAFTAHNVNASRRDGTDSLLNRLTLRIQYHAVDHIFVHTEKMKAELISEFRVKGKAITVLPYPINSVIPETALHPAQAKRRLGIENDSKTILFFGRICPYKGLEYLLAALRLLAAKDSRYRLIIAGEPSQGASDYMERIERIISDQSGVVIPVIRFIPDEDVELFFKAADVLVLPYKEIFQSGVLFMAYGFGLPVIATDVGSFRESIAEGNAGLVCRACDAADLARAIEEYFESTLFHHLDHSRRIIREFARLRHSPETAAALTRRAYEQLNTRSI
jgi:glycosyltransferase involved in cell wall biosynthesis